MESRSVLFGLPLLRPMLAVAGEVFNSDEHIFEVKWDGYRCLAYLGADTELRSRNLKDLTPIFPELSALYGSCRELPAIVDGEIVVFDNGHPSFNRLQARGRLTDQRRIQSAARSSPALYVAFDLLYAGGKPLMEKTLKERKYILEQIMSPNHGLIVSQYVAGQGLELAKACAARGLEGVVAKRLDSPYLPGKRSRYWRKIHHHPVADLVICGYQPGRGGRRLGALVLGYYSEGQIVFCGKVGTGFDHVEEAMLLDCLDALTNPGPVMPLPEIERRRTRWVEPVLVCAVRYLSLTSEGLLRHPSYQGLRDGKSPLECVHPEEQRYA